MCHLLTFPAAPPHIYGHLGDGIPMIIIVNKYNNYEYQPNNQSHLVLAPVRMVVRAEEGLLLWDQVRRDPGALCKILLARIL